MLRTLVRAILVIVILVAVGAFFLGYRVSRSSAGVAVHRSSEPVGTTGVIDTDKAREKAARVGEKAAVVANDAAKALDDGALTAKIKAKMALDDYVKARDINVDTSDGVVTLKGFVHSELERERALRLARETDGVRSVNDRLEIRLKPAR